MKTKKLLSINDLERTIERSHNKWFEAEYDDLSTTVNDHITTILLNDDLSLEYKVDMIIKSASLLEDYGLTPSTGDYLHENEELFEDEPNKTELLKLIEEKTE